MSELFGFLYAKPSFVEGLARALDMGGTLQEYNRSLTSEDADKNAIRADWQTIMRDLDDAVARVTNERSGR